MSSYDKSRILSMLFLLLHGEFLRKNKSFLLLLRSESLPRKRLFVFFPFFGASLFLGNVPSYYYSASSSSRRVSFYETSRLILQFRLLDGESCHRKRLCCVGVFTASPCLGKVSSSSLSASSSRRVSCWETSFPRRRHGESLLMKFYCSFSVSSSRPVSS